jgi:hypothetical protein
MLHRMITHHESIGRPDLASIGLALRQGLAREESTHG